MAKPLQQDSEGNIINDVETQKNQKGYANYEADLKKRQEEMKAKSIGKQLTAEERGLNLIKMGSDLLSPVEKKAKGGMIKSSASKRADGCAIRGKTRA